MFIEAILFYFIFLVKGLYKETASLCLCLSVCLSL